MDWDLRCYTSRVPNLDFLPPFAPDQGPRVAQWEHKLNAQENELYGLTEDKIATVGGHA